MDLAQAREAIDSVDAQITELFCQRMQLAAEICAVKQRDNLPLLSEAREQEILSRAAEQAGEELAVYARELFSTLLKLSKEYQRQLAD